MRYLHTNSLLQATLWSLVLLLWQAPFAMDSRIREATYLYEFEGRNAEAMKLLQAILTSGTPSDQQMACFHLAKMYDWEGNREKAVQYYNRFIGSNPSESDMLYWAANRLSSLQTSPTPLVLMQTRMLVPIVKRIPGKPPAFLVGNEALWRPYGKEPLARLRWLLPSNSQLLELSNHSAWLYQEEARTLQEISLKSKQVLSSVPLDAPLISSLRLQSGDWFLMTSKNLLLARNGRILWKKNNHLGDCTPEAELSLLRQVLLNCPDNAIHPIDVREGKEMESIGLLESIDTIIASPDGIWVTTPSTLWHFKPNRSRQAVWQQSFSSIHSILYQGDRIALLEGDGSLNLFQSSDGVLLSRSRLEPGFLFPIDHRMGLVTQSGNLQILDLDGQPLWRYQAGSPIACLPILTDSLILLPLANQRIIGLNVKYYGLPQSDILVRTDRLDQLAAEGNWDPLKQEIDTILLQEPGNARAWMYRARYYSEKKSIPDSAIRAWSQAARHSRNLSGTAQQSILKPYARRLGASWIQYLPPSTQTYPKLFGDSRNLFTIDAGNRSLVAMDPYSGQFRWRTTTPPLDPSFLTVNDGRIIAIASGYDISIHDLSRKGRLMGTLSLPGKAFQITMDRSAIFVSTWNGFVLRFQKKNLEPLWSRKVFSSGCYLAPHEENLHVLSLEGELSSLTTESGTSHGKVQVPGTPSGIVVGDSILIHYAQDGRVAVFHSQTLQPIWVQQFGSQVFSAQVIPDNGKGLRILLGLADQRILMLDAKTRNIVWSMQGRGSIYIHPEVQGNRIFIDQSASILALDVEDGHIVQEFLLPDGAGPLWTNQGMVFSSSPQGLLFAYPIPR